MLIVDENYPNWVVAEVVAVVVAAVVVAAVVVGPPPFPSVGRDSSAMKQQQIPMQIAPPTS